MPLYEYQCDACAHRFEVIQKFSDSPLDTCPKCGGVIRKLLSSPAIQFKGSGWYITDYARTGKSDDAKTDSAAKSESGSSTADGSTPAAKADTKTADTKAASKPESKRESKPSAPSTPD
jgi:putative FmdB family regulatory protein